MGGYMTELFMGIYLVFHHINLQGKYHFTLPEEVAQGQHRPLRDPQTVQDDL